MDSLGRPMWDSSGVVVTDGPSIDFTLLPSGADALVVWMWEQSSNDDIHAQRISAEGAVMWTPDGVALVTAPSLQEEPSAASDGQGGAIAAWDDLRSYEQPGVPAHIAVFAQRVRSDGSVTSAGDEDFGARIPARPTLEQNYPNPFNPTTTIRYSTPVRAHVRLAIFDLLGRQVRTIQNQIQEAGEHEAVWNGRDDHGLLAASGVYIYTLQFERSSVTRKLIFLR